MLALKTEERDNQLENGGSLQKLEEERKRILPGASRKECSPARALMALALDFRPRKLV